MWSDESRLNLLQSDRRFSMKDEVMPPSSLVPTVQARVDKCLGSAAVYAPGMRSTD